MQRSVFTSRDQSRHLCWHTWKGTWICSFHSTKGADKQQVMRNSRWNNWESARYWLISSSSWKCFHLSITSKSEFLIRHNDIAVFHETLSSLLLRLMMQCARRWAPRKKITWTTPPLALLSLWLEYIWIFLHTAEAVIISEWFRTRSKHSCGAETTLWWCLSIITYFPLTHAVHMRRGMQCFI